MTSLFFNILTYTNVSINKVLQDIFWVYTFIVQWFSFSLFSTLQLLRNLKCNSVNLFLTLVNALRDGFRSSLSVWKPIFLNFFFLYIYVIWQKKLSKNVPHFFSSKTNDAMNNDRNKRILTFKVIELEIRAEILKKKYTKIKYMKKYWALTQWAVKDRD